MKIQFLGATQTVTGSRYLVTAGETKVLVDCGLFQGFKFLRLRNREPFPVPLRELDAVLLTHAHLDHSGYIPLLLKSGFKGVVYATAPTIALCKILLPDSGYLQEEEAKFANKRGYSKHKPALPLYTVEEARASLSLFRPVQWKTPFQITKNGSNPIECQFYPAGHLLGAASIEVRAEGKSIAFSGDLGRKNDPLIREPSPQFSVDNLVVESTYGNREHPTRNPEEELRVIVDRTFRKGGSLLIPSFAVGRAQIILYYLLQLRRKKLLPDIPIYLNSPMASEANQAFASYPEELKVNELDMNEVWKSVRIIGTAEESKVLNGKKNPSIIIAASGMATGGRVLHHIKSLAPDAKNTILFVGFQAGGTRGDLMIKGAEQVKIHGEFWPIRAEIVNLETLSSHADVNETIDWIKSLEKKPERVFVTHGEPEAANALSQKITSQLGLSTVVPEYKSEFIL